jgi:hypothetical protein
VDRRLHQRWTFNHFGVAVWKAKAAESAAHELVENHHPLRCNLSHSGTRNHLGAGGAASGDN